MKPLLSPSDHPLRAFHPAAILACAVVWVAIVCPAVAVAPPDGPFDGIATWAEVRSDPPQRLFIAQIDLGTPNLRVRVAPGGLDPDGDGPWQTTLQTPTRIAAREGFDLVVNGDFFIARSAAAGETNGPGYRVGVWGRVVGPAVSGGVGWAPASEPRPCLVVRDDGGLEIKMLAEPGPAKREVIAGNQMLLADGRPVAPPDPARHPRTAVGLSRDGGKLFILVADGRRPGIAAGMTYADLIAEFLRLGCHDALNLDGGGSSVLAVRDPESGDYRVMNRPADGRERAVANVLGITVESQRE
jgi:hypothetical protein